MNKWIQSFCAGVGLLAVTVSPAAAQFSANAALTNNYVWRGVTQSDERFAVQGGVDYDFGMGAAVGAWASTVDFNDATDFELDLYGSYSGMITDMMGFTAGGIAYLYPNQPGSTDYNFFEIYGGLDFNLDPATVSGKIYYAPDIYNDSAWYFTGGVAVPVTDFLEVGANAGYWIWESSSDPWDWNAGATFSWEQFSLFVGYADTDLAGFDGQFIATVSVSLP